MNDNYLKGFRIDWDKVPKDSYLQRIGALRKIDELYFDNQITFFVGENGSGKSTLLEALAVNYGFNREGGSRNYNFSTFDEAEELKDVLTIYKAPKKYEYNYFFRAETFFNVASKENEYQKGPGGDPQYYHEKSHGEGFLHLFEKLASARGLYLFDEPEAALSLSRQLSLFSLICKAAKRGSQFIIISHSPILLGIPDADIFSFEEDGIKKISYEETQSYKIMKSFIEHRQLMIDELLK